MNAQDIHWAHIHASPTFLNPAMTGVFQGQMRFIGNVRAQWTSFDKGYKTISGGMDTKLFTLNRKDFIGMGVQLFADQAGDLNFTTKSASLSFSGVKTFDRHGRNAVSFGLQNSLFNNSVDFTKVVAYDFIPEVAGEIPDNIYYWSLSAGVAWFYAFDKYNSFYLGGSYSHLNEPLVSFINRDNPERANILYRKIILHGGADIRIAEGFDLKPSFIFMDQGPHREINMGSYIRYKSNDGLSKKSTYKVYVGGWLRYYIENDTMGADALVASIRIDYKDLFITFSYDLNLSKLHRISFGRGGPEFSVIKIIDNPRTKRRVGRVKCPSNFN